MTKRKNDLKPKKLTQVQTGTLETRHNHEKMSKKMKKKPIFIKPKKADSNELLIEDLAILICDLIPNLTVSKSNYILQQELGKSPLQMKKNYGHNEEERMELTKNIQFLFNLVKDKYKIDNDTVNIYDRLCFDFPFFKFYSLEMVKMIGKYHFHY